ncbi:MAG: hypothetical protein PVF05_07650 [Gemmatimonadales bacterium]
MMRTIMENSVRRLSGRTPAALLLAGLVLAAATTACAPGAGDPEAAPSAEHEAPALLPTHLDLDLKVDYDAGRVDGLATWTLRNVGDVAIREVPVQVGRLMRVRGVRLGQRPLDVEQDVVTYGDWPEFQVDQAWARLPEPLAPGASAEISIDYGGILVPYTETGMRYVQDHVDRDFTILRSESFAFPQVRVPSYAGLRSMPRGEFTYSMRLTAPSDLVVATGAPEKSKTPAGDSLSTWTFASDTPVPFLFAAIAPYEVLSDGDLRVYHLAEDGEGARTLMSAMRETLSTYERWFGDVNAPLRLHVIEIPEGWGSQADLHAGIIQTADAFRDRSQLSQLYHELAHLWHPADVDAAPPRWNEGLATFLAHRMAAERGESAPLDSVFAALARRQVARFENGAPSDTLAMIDYGVAGATDLSYGTGALMFYALYRMLGPDAFDRALASWFRTYRESGSTTPQFVATMEAAGGPGLEPVFRDWLETAGWYQRLGSGEDLAALVASYRGGR